MAEINITPFTDVILVLLIVFMVTTPLIFQSGVKVNLPQSSTKEPLEYSKPTQITITSEGTIYLGDRFVTQKELKQGIEILLRKDENLNVILFADQTSRFREVVGVMDILNELGVKNLSIATKTNP